MIKSDTDSLNTDSLNTDSLNTDSLNTDYPVSKHLKKIEDADIEKIFVRPNTFRAYVCSKTGTGKTVAVNHILSFLTKKYVTCYLFSGTAQIQKDIYSFCPEENKFNSFDEEKLESIYNNQFNSIMEQMKARPKNGLVSEDDYKKGLKHILIIFDDIISDNRVRHSNSNSAFTKLFVQGRHINISVCFISQYFSSAEGLGVVQRKNCDIFLSFLLTTEADQEGFVNNCMSKSSKKEGKELYVSICCEKPYQCVITTNTTTREFPTYVYKFVADLKIKKFKFGLDDYQRDPVQESLFYFMSLNRERDQQEERERKVKRKKF